MDRDSDLGESRRRRIAEIVGSRIVAGSTVHGGDVASSYRLELEDGRTIFAKTHASPPANFFDTEARGLQWLQEVGAVRVPAVLGVSETPPLLVLEWIDEGHRALGDEAAFGAGLAALHRASPPTFGRKDRRTTGSRGLPNDPCRTWIDFYATQRLLPLVRLARNGGVYDRPEIGVFEKVASRLEVIGGPAEPPARLHGDLWAGNRIVDTEGVSWLIDPACHGGHREFDLAMMQLFGGFGDRVFDAYHEAHPLSAGWGDRVALHQIAPLLVHAIKFGGSYVPAALAAARRYV